MSIIVYICLTVKKIILTGGVFFSNYSKQFLILYNMFMFPFIKRWIFSVNHKDIGILYLIFGCFSGIIGTLLSFFMRFELSIPGETNIFSSNYQLYNTAITGYALIIIFIIIIAFLYFFFIMSIINVTLYFESAALVFAIKAVAFIGALVVCSVYIQNPSILPVYGVPSNEVVSLANEMAAFKSDTFTSAKQEDLTPFLKECVSLRQYQNSRDEIFRLIMSRSRLETLLSWEENTVVADSLKEKIRNTDFIIRNSIFFHKIKYPAFSKIEL